MGTWISHLRIAENLLSHFPELDEVTFAFGNLSPDSGIPNADWTEFDPPKEITHFLRTGEGEGEIHDLVYYEQYLLNIKPEDTSGRELGIAPAGNQRCARAADDHSRSLDHLYAIEVVPGIGQDADQRMFI